MELKPEIGHQEAYRLDLCRHCKDQVTSIAIVQDCNNPDNSLGTSNAISHIPQEMMRVVFHQVRPLTFYKGCAIKDT